jgi:hypothetical protein
MCTAGRTFSPGCALKTLYGSTPYPDVDVAQLDGRVVGERELGQPSVGSPPGSAFLPAAVAQNAVLNWQHVFLPTIINEDLVGHNGPKTRTSGIAPQSARS